ncbi:winged helix-turn-helix domain-containing protein [Bosea sp. 685]|uniref:winged helix-turn-helix domain-containing protein n=1 Tax=Bosea sp. 685 TaxID=3080057 RepID=UPI0028931F73|nr:winged helix-turn-helix domain-containing protein [Bosea sp. 685]WNJ93982.1 winged helix-turn-helix domain-containing protein [Bosea sp. 685]
MTDQLESPRTLLAFDGFVLDLTRGVLTAEAREVVLRPKTTAVLAHLLAHAGQIVSRDALLTAVWGDVAVSDDSLTQCVSEIRRALGTVQADLLQTHARRGYVMATRLCPVAPAADPSALFTPGAGANAATPPGSEAPMQAGSRPRSRLAWAALVVGGFVVGGLGLVFSAAAWISANRLPEPVAPSVVASAKPSSWDEARRLLGEGRGAQQGGGTYEERLRASLPLFLRALAVEPRLAEAAAEAAFVHTNLRTTGASRDPELDLREAERLAALAMAAMPKASLSLAAQAAVLRQQRRFAEAIVFYERAGADPVRVIDRANAGIMHLMLGDAEAAQPPLRAALQESPLHQFSAGWRVYLGLAKLMTGQPDQAADDFLTSTALSFPTEERLFYRLVALQGAGRLAEAQALDTNLRQRDLALLARPLRAFGMSDEAAYRARFETAVLAPLHRMGWVQIGR